MPWGVSGDPKDPHGGHGEPRKPMAGGHREVLVGSGVLPWVLRGVRGVIGAGGILGCFGGPGVPLTTPPRPHSGAAGKPYITLEQLRDFVNTRQRDPRLNEVLFPPLSPEQTRQLIERYEPNLQFRQRGAGGPGGGRPRGVLAGSWGDPAGSWRSWTKVWGFLGGWRRV